MSEAPIVVEHVDHAFGEGELRRQVLFDVCAEISTGEIVILTGPSGSGKTTLLTLIGALRSTQQGSLRVLGRELRGADEATLAGIRRRIGYIFQAHNLLEALTALQNVEMSLQLDADLAGEPLEERALQALEAVGLDDRAGAHPSQLSGGQRQRVAIARALARRPEILLADEPTASLDRETGRGVVQLLQRLARESGVTVVLVTHDGRILDVADRILALEDGRLSSLMNAVAADARHMLRLLAQDTRRGELVRRVTQLDESEFRTVLDQVTAETRGLLEVVDLVQSDAFESVLEQVVRAFTSKVGELFDADRPTLLFLDEDSGELRAPGAAASAGRAAEPAGRAGDGEPAVELEAVRDRRSLSVPVADSRGNVFALVELRDKRGGALFDAADEERLRELTASLGVILESWWRMSCACRRAAVGRTCPCCGNSWHLPGPSGADEAT